MRHEKGIIETILLLINDNEHQKIIKMANLSMITKPLLQKLTSTYHSFPLLELQRNKKKGNKGGLMTNSSNFFINNKYRNWIEFEF